jgi:hypothetical protein
MGRLVSILGLSITLTVTAAPALAANCDDVPAQKIGKCWRDQFDATEPGWRTSRDADLYARYLDAIDFVAEAAKRGASANERTQDFIKELGRTYSELIADRRQLAEAATHASAASAAKPQPSLCADVTFPKLAECLRADLETAIPAWQSSQNVSFVNTFFYALHQNVERVANGQITEEWARAKALDSYKAILPLLAF